MRKNCRSIAIFDNDLLHDIVHHLTKFKADSWNPQTVRAITSSFWPGPNLFISGCIMFGLEQKIVFSKCRLFSNHPIRRQLQYRIYLSDILLSRMIIKYQFENSYIHTLSKLWGVKWANYVLYPYMRHSKNKTKFVLHNSLSHPVEYVLFLGYTTVSLRDLIKRLSNDFEPTPIFLKIILFIK